jgi:hypothetical protein
VPLSQVVVGLTERRGDLKRVERQVFNPTGTKKMVPPECRMGSSMASALPFTAAPAVPSARRQSYGDTRDVVKDHHGQLPGGRRCRSGASHPFARQFAEGFCRCIRTGVRFIGVGVDKVFGAG